MKTWNLEEERNALESVLYGRNLDFSATFMRIQDLHAFVRKHPEIIRPQTVTVLKRVLKGSEHIKETQSFFLYKEAADVLAAIIVNAMNKPLADLAMGALKHVVGSGTDQQHRAASEALGSLPLRIRGPQLCKKPIENMPRVEWEAVFREKGIPVCSTPTRMGRSLVAATENENRMLVIKLACTYESMVQLNKEAEWMAYFCSKKYDFPVRFEIPIPIMVNGSYIFRLENPPASVPEKIGTYSACYAIGFMVHKDYFVYPNEPGDEKRLDEEKFSEVMTRNAWLLGKLTALGIVHTAPIPLFHNRVQRMRRQDQGIYEWPRGGRLDRWLYSSRYPNLGMTGIRDFEHFFAFTGPNRKLFQHIGAHLLSLFLVTGSYFRNKNTERVGFDQQGLPVDARELFDKPLFKRLAQEIFLRYYNGFTGNYFQETMPANFDKLTSRMIEEMGIDRHMDEILRVAEQNEMTDHAFRRFLSERGYADAEIERLKKGADNITIQTGPHLGGFNERISLPELIRFLATASAYCIADRYEAAKTSVISQRQLTI